MPTTTTNNSGAKVWYGEANEGGTAHALARLVSLDGSGSEVKPGEGACLLQTDVSSITCAVYDLGTNPDEEAGTEVTPAPTVTVAANLFDTLRTVGWPTQDDPHGYNFRHDVGPEYLADPNEWRLFEYRITLDSGGVVWFLAKVKTRPVQST